MFSEFKSLLFYIFVFCGSSYLLGFARQNQTKKTFFYKLMIGVALAIPILVAGYRSCGTDTLVYLRNYVTYVDLSWAEVFDKVRTVGEPGHIMLTKLLGYFSHPRLYLAFYAALTVILVYIASKHFKDEGIALTMLIYYFVFFVFSFNGMRQYIAIAIITLSFKFIFERKFIKYLITILIAGSFHTSAMFTFPLYFLWRKKGDILPWVLTGPILIIIFVLGLNLDSILDALSSYELESLALQRYITYTDVMESKNRDFYLNLLVAFIMLLHYPRLKKVNPQNAFFVVLMFIGTLLGVIGFTSPYAKRIATYFSIAEIWVLSDIPRCYTDHHSIWVTRLLIILYALLRFILVAYILGQAGLIPYIWVLPGWAQI